MSHIFNQPIHFKLERDEAKELLAELRLANSLTTTPFAKLSELQALLTKALGAEDV